MNAAATPTEIESVSVDLFDIYGGNQIRTISNRILGDVSAKFGVHINTKNNDPVCIISKNHNYVTSDLESAANVLKAMHGELASKSEKIHSSDILTRQKISEIMKNYSDRAIRKPTIAPAREFDGAARLSRRERKLATRFNGGPGEREIKNTASELQKPLPIQKSGQSAISDPVIETPVKKEGDRFVCPVKFDLPLFDETGYVKMKMLDGEAKEWHLTANQKAYKDAQFDPNVQLVVAHGVAGSGKTDIMIWCSLRKLQLGLIKKIYYERPMVAIDDIKVGALPGGLNAKTSPYNSVFVEKLITWLANGDKKRGEKIFNELKSRGIIEQYNGLFKGGDTIRHAALNVDEAANKSLDELYHLATRAGEGACIVISGDFEFQNSLKKGRLSGFMDFVEIIKNVPLARTIEMLEEDCKRGPLPQQVYAARKAWEAAKMAKIEARPDHASNLRASNGHSPSP